RSTCFAVTKRCSLSCSMLFSVQLSPHANISNAARPLQRQHTPLSAKRKLAFATYRKQQGFGMTGPGPIDHVHHTPNSIHKPRKPPRKTPMTAQIASLHSVVDDKLEKSDVATFRWQGQHTAPIITNQTISNRERRGLCRCDLRHQSRQQTRPN